MSEGLTFKFVGTGFTVQTGFTAVSPPQAITNITSANPAVVSSAAHGYTEGDVVRIQNVVGKTEVNNRLFAVDNPISGSYELAGEDSTNGMAYISGGSTDEVIFTEFCELDGVNQQDGQADQHEVTTICSTAKQFVSGLGDSGTLSLDYNYAPGAAVQIALRAAQKSGATIAFKIVLPEAGGTAIMLGNVQALSRSGSLSGVVWRGSASIKLSGPIFEL